MEITNNSTIDSVMDFANVKFGMELTKDEVSIQLRELTFSETLKLLNSIKADDNDAFAEIINMSVEEAALSEEELEENWLKVGGAILMFLKDKIKKGLGAGAGASKKKADDIIATMDKNGVSKVTGWTMGTIGVTSAASIAIDITTWVGKVFSGEVLTDMAEYIWKNKLPAGAVIAALYGGKKLIDYVADLAKDPEKEKGTTINNYYGVDEMPATESDTTRLRELAGAPKEEIINEIDPSRSPWTQNGKHPGAMDADELRNELAVFAELRDRGDYLSPRELAQEDSLFDYLEQIDGPQVDWENESVVDNQTNEASDELARLIQLSRHGIESIPEAYGTISSAQPSRATIRAGDTQNKTANRRANNINQDMNRDAKVSRLGANGVPGYKNPNPTGTGASRAGSADPDDIHRSEIEQVARGSQDQSLTNAQEIERLKQLAMGG